MCGLTGFLGKPQLDSLEMQSCVSQMSDTLFHRGPDDKGTWVDNKSGIALGHQRLSILDLSAAGHQPMHSTSGRFVLAFNGEIYNHLDIRKEIELYESKPKLWNGHSDTETLLGAFEVWGIEKTLGKCNGMFAFSLWDVKKEVLTLGRDRFGEKPLYYGWVKNSFVFGSELKAIKAFPDFDNKINRDALSDYLRFMYVPAPKSIYDDIYKLEPGSYIQIDSRTKNNKDIEPVKYWNFLDEIKEGKKKIFKDENEALFALEDALEDSIKLQMLADVPVGAFLSGGVDSSLIVSLMQKYSTQPVKTFTVGFEESEFDESPFSKAVAKHLGTNHHELFVSSEEMRSVIALLPEMYDEPFADSSQIPTHLVSVAAKEEVTVSLSGDAGDELFGGYNRYLWAPRIWNKVSWIPFPLRRFLGSSMTALSENKWNSIGSAVNSIYAGSDGILRLGEKAHKLGKKLNLAKDFDGLYFSLVTEWEDPGSLVKKQEHVDNEDYISDFFERINKSGLEIKSSSRMMSLDSVTYLPDDILCKVDRAAMAKSLETRVPFLDHRVASLSCRLPMSMKIRGNEGKWALRKILYKYVPKNLIERPKSGFSIPLDRWLRGPLREWAEELLDESRIEEEGYFHAKPIREYWNQHLNGTNDWGSKLWVILMFQSWLKENS